jgi:hypothetical protein
MWVEMVTESQLRSESIGKLFKRFVFPATMGIVVLVYKLLSMGIL